MKNFVLTGVCLLIVYTIYGQSEKDSTGTYNNNEGFGGPKSVGAQLQIDNQPKFDYRFPIKVTKPWYDFKTNFSKETEASDRPLSWALFDWIIWFPPFADVVPRAHRRETGRFGYRCLKAAILASKRSLAGWSFLKF